MRLSVAANYDPEIIPQLAEYPVEEIYGRFPLDTVGGGRPAYMGTPLPEKHLADYVRTLQENGIAFNYLLNSSCLSNREWTRKWQKRLLKLLEKISRMGIRRLTVSTPYLLERIKKTFPQFSIRVGIFAQVDTPRRARFWADLGADNITLESFSINRNFKQLEVIRRAVDCDLTLIANHPCLPNCPMQYYHQDGFAHSSNRTGRFFIDYCFLRCTYERLRDPSYLIKSCWIRPEDVAFYEDMGYHHFKILERDIPSSQLLKRVHGYRARCSPPDLTELILPYGFEEPQKRQRLWFVKNFFKPTKINPLKLKPLYDFAKKQGMLFPSEQRLFHIDSSKIPGDFIRGFEGRNCSELSCTDCGYCQTIAAQAVRLDENRQMELLDRFEQIHNMLISGTLWHV
jgi:collagenase-like PrtC family protease